MNVIKQIQVSVYTLSLLESGIVHVHVSGEQEETIESQTAAIRAAGELLEWKAAPTLYTYGEFALPNEEVRANYAKKETNPYTLADGFVVNSIALGMLANFYLRINKPVRPTRFFRNTEDALEWLSGFLK